MIYFSYGSNMPTARIRSRIPAARPVTVALLREHQLVFHKCGTDGSGKCDVVHTSRSSDLVYGVAWEIISPDKLVLDRIEGLGKGYEQKQVSIATPHGETFRAYTYYASLTDPEQRPYSWYKEHVLRGAIEHGLPESYIRFIRTVEARHDPEQHRHDQELSIYR